MTSALLTAGQLKPVLVYVRPAVERVVVGVRPGQDVLEVLGVWLGTFVEPLSLWIFEVIIQI